MEWNVRCYFDAELSELQGKDELVLFPALVEDVGPLNLER